MVLAATAAQAQETAALQPFSGPAEIVDVCEVEPDYFDGNCPPTVNQQFEAFLALGIGNDALNSEVADTAVALAERGQQAAAEFDIPLCIDIAQGIVRTAQYSTDSFQRESIIQLARFTCCINIIGASYGYGIGATVELPISGDKNDGGILNGGATFSSAGALFNTDDVQPGDILLITSGGQQGFYIIGGVTDENTLVLRQDDVIVFPGWDLTESDLEYQIRRLEADYEDYICDPGFQTAAITPLVPTPQGSPN